MVNKKGFLKIVEAGIAVFIVLAAILLNFNNLRNIDEPDYSELSRDILREIAENVNYRTEVLMFNTGDVNSGNVFDFVNGKVPKFLTFELKACDLDDVCGQSLLPNYDGNIYSGERIISTDLNNFDPVKLRLFIWEEGR
jgi:hypothetical protein